MCTKRLKPKKLQTARFVAKVSRRPRTTCMKSLNCAFPFFFHPCSILLSLIIIATVLFYQITLKSCGSFQTRPCVSKSNHPFPLKRAEHYTVNSLPVAPPATKHSSLCSTQPYIACCFKLDMVWANRIVGFIFKNRYPVERALSILSLNKAHEVMHWPKE